MQFEIPTEPVVCNYFGKRVIQLPPEKINWSMTGKELKSLMRRNRVTIRELAKRMGLYLSQIRRRLEIGLSGSIVLDYHEGVTGASVSPRVRAQWAQYRRQTQLEFI